MKRLTCSFLYASALLCNWTYADLVGTGIVDSVTVNRTDIGGGLDEIIVTVDIGLDTFSVVDGGFSPVGSALFNQNNFLAAADPTPATVLFAGALWPTDDTTFLLTRDFGDPVVDDPGVDTSSELSSLSIAYPSGTITGTFGLARLVVPNNAAFAVANVLGSVNPGAITFAVGGSPVGSISGSIAAVPEAGQLASLALLTLVVLSGQKLRHRTHVRD